MPRAREFWDLIEVTDGCWLWTGYIDRGGYGRHGRHGYAHRMMYEMAVAPIPDGLVIDHLCKVRHCVNPDHMDSVTNAENSMRGDGPMAEKARQTHCIHDHEFTPENTLNHGGRRACRECNRIRCRQWYWSTRAESA